MRFGDYIDQFIDDMRADGRINSSRTEVSYRGTLEAHAEDVENRDATLTGREDVKQTLRRWTHPNSQGTCRAHLVSFYDWMVEEGKRPYNPARQTRRPRRRKPEVYRLTRDEATSMLAACRGRRERWAIHVGMLAGLRRAELLGLQGRHFQRDGFIWVSPDIAKGGRGRHVPILSDLLPIVEEIRDALEPDDFMLPAQRFRDPGVNRVRRDYRKHRSSEQALWRLVREVAKRAGIAAEIGPHALRHAFGDFVARYAGLDNARALMGHADVGTTKTYVGEPTLDELVGAIQGFRIGGLQLFPADRPAIPLKAPTGIEPVDGASRLLERFFGSQVLREASRAIR